MPDISNAFVVVMGVGTVFVGLICIIVLCKIVGLFCTIGSKNEVATKTQTPTTSTVIENREEIIAAVTAACAEEMGKDVSALRVVSFKKI